MRYTGDQLNNRENISMSFHNDVLPDAVSFEIMYDKIYLGNIAVYIWAQPLLIAW